MLVSKFCFVSFVNTCNVFVSFHTLVNSGGLWSMLPISDWLDLNRSLSCSLLPMPSARATLRISLFILINISESTMANNTPPPQHQCCSENNAYKAVNASKRATNLQGLASRLNKIKFPNSLAKKMWKNSDYEAATWDT